ncbi:MAG TPA: cation diffusion facilitator family transporter [Methanoregulaceae archaeon]|nr:cation diffusion facilitator family transporter [Methanoregulaceae archaeon]
MERRQYEKPLKVAVVVTLFFCGVEFAGGVISGSLSLISDGGHMLVDAFALILSLGAMIVARKLPTMDRTFGYHRVEIMAALANSIVLILLSAVITWEALERLANPRPVSVSLMFFVALIGLAANIFIAFLLHGSHDLNVKSAFLHVIGDALSSVAVVGAAVWITLTGQTFMDPVLSIVIVAVILVSAFRILRETLTILLQFTPKDTNPEEVIADILSVEGVEGVHNVHLWSLCSHINIIDAHVFSSERRPEVIERMKGEIKSRLAKYDIKHSTLEFECTECEDRSLVREIVA